MRKLIYIVLLFVSHVAFGQADVWTTRPVTNTGANFNKQSNHMANTTFDFTLRIPRSTHFTLNGGKDTLGAIAYALDVHKMGVYRGSGVWDTLSNAGSITQSQVLHLADSLLSKLNIGDSTKYATQYFVKHNFVPYIGATGNVDIGTYRYLGQSVLLTGVSPEIDIGTSGAMYHTSGTGDSFSVTLNADGSFTKLAYNFLLFNGISGFEQYIQPTDGTITASSNFRLPAKSGAHVFAMVDDIPGSAGFTNGLTKTDSVRLGGDLQSTTIINTNNQTIAILDANSSNMVASFTGKTNNTSNITLSAYSTTFRPTMELNHGSGGSSTNGGLSFGRTKISDNTVQGLYIGVNQAGTLADHIYTVDTHNTIGIENIADYSASYATHPLALAQNGWISSNFMDLTTNQSAAGNKQFTGQIQATGGVSPDGMGPISVTMPGNSTNYAYYGMTRSGITAVAMGVDNLNAFVIGTGPTRNNGATIDTLLFRLNTHNGNLMLYGTLSVPGITTLANYYTTSGTPTGALGSSTVVGTGAALTINGTNQDGEITLVTGTGISATGNAFTVTMNGFAYPTKCTPVISSQLDLGVSGPRLTVNSLTGTSWTLNGGGNQFTSSTTYKFTYHNGGY